MIQSSYVPLDTAAAINDHGEIVQSGETCRIDALKDHFAWMRGFVNGFYGWPNDGKSLMTDYLMMVKSMKDGWKWCIYKDEDMDTVVIDKKVHIKANRIYKNLAWIYTGKTWNRGFSEKYKTPMMTMNELREALEFVTEHFYVIRPNSRQYNNVLSDFKFMYEKFGVDGFMIDPWNVMKLDSTKRGDEMLIDAFIDVKEFALLTNSVVNIVSHPRTQREVKEKNGVYKVVDQFMQLGGSAWDIKLDGQYSIHRPLRHKDPRNPLVDFYNLKQKQFEIVGVNKGVVEGIELDFIKKQYYFNGVNPISGHVVGKAGQGAMNFKQKEEPLSDAAPF